MSVMDAEQSADPNFTSEAHRLDGEIRDQFPVILDMERWIGILERNISRVWDLTVLAVGVGLGIAFGELFENWGDLGWSWGSASVCGATILAVIVIDWRYFN